MYKLLLCVRYLRTRYIALACIISVTLGVATMIVVNSVMSGFSHEMIARMQSMIADVSLESRGLDGFPNSAWHMDEVRRILGDDIVGMTPTVAVPSLFNMQVGQQTVTRECVLIGIDPASFATVSNCNQFFLHPGNREQLDFNLREQGFPDRLPSAGWPYRRRVAERQKELAAIYGPPPSQAARPQPTQPRPANEPLVLAPSAEDDSAAGHAVVPASATAEIPAALPDVRPADVAAAPEAAAAPVDDWGGAADAGWDVGAKEQHVFDPAQEQNPGIVLGIALANYRDAEGKEHFLKLPGDDVQIAFWLAGMSQRTAVSSDFTIVDFSESKMSEYDSRFVFVDIKELQRMRGMVDPQSGVANVSSIQIKLRDGVDPEAARQKLQAHFSPSLYVASTWRDKQGPLLEAVKMETTILNILLFMIIAVAGFGILAIFSMIVAEKTKDIGVLKSLGASSSGIMSIFLGYGLSLGLVGSVGGMILGLLFVHYIDTIRGFVEGLSGQQLFDPQIYYFQAIPTLVEPWTVGWIVIGALLIAVMASILPAFRAARLQPVEALRYE